MYKYMLKQDRKRYLINDVTIDDFSSIKFGSNVKRDFTPGPWKGDIHIAQYN